MVGIIYPEHSLLFRMACATAESKNGDGKSYELNTTPDGQPCIRSETTGKYFVIPWNELIGLAIKAGIDDAEVPHGA